MMKMKIVRTIETVLLVLLAAALLLVLLLPKQAANTQTATDPDTEGKMSPLVPFGDGYIQYAKTETITFYENGDGGRIGRVNLSEIGPLRESGSAYGQSLRFEDFDGDGAADLGLPAGRRGGRMVPV